MAEQVRDLSTELHQLSYQLHPAKLDQLGLVAAARAFCNEMSAQSEMRIGFTHEDVPQELPAETALCVYRILQETLGNALRHSGAVEAHVDLRMANRHHLFLKVSDDGRGFDLAQAERGGGLGLLSMRERARLVHGSLEIRTEPGHGTRVELRVPLGPAATEAEGAA
jgi:signal transduction histidine kinase